MSNQLLFATQARFKMAEGAKALAEAVKVTLGPRGRNVVIEQDFGAPLIVNDGVTIAKSITLKDKFENLGASILIEAASKTNDLVGDGTTTAILLTSQLIEEGLKLVEQGNNPVLIRKGLQFYLEHINQSIDKVSTPVVSSSELSEIASISSGAKEVGVLISKAYEEVGHQGIVTIEESQGLEDYLDIVKGYSYDRGYLSSYMVTDKEKQEAILDHPLVYISDKKIITMKEILPYLEQAMQMARPLCIICDDIEQEVLGALVVNKLRGVLNVVVTKAPSFGERKTKQLQDIAMLTKATIVDENTQSLESEVMLGNAEKIIVSKEQTIIVNGVASSDEIDCYVNGLKKELENTTSEYDKEKINERLGKILGGIAVIKIGAETEPVLKEKKLRIEDALNATKAAMASGVIEGGGKVLYQISNQLKEIPAPKEYAPALQMLEIALKTPFFQIVANAGENPEKILKHITGDLWYDAYTNEIVNLKEKGIIDPASVEKSAIMSAISIAGIFLTTECAIINNDMEKKVDEENLL